MVAESALPEKAGNGDGDTPLYSPAWVARRLGVTPATLRTWHHRYDLGPTGRTTGRHRRYSPTDLERFDRMRQLTTGGIGVAEAARLSHESPITTRHGRAEHEDPPKPTTVPAAQLERLIAAADDLDQVSTGRIVHDALRVHGVVSTWDELVTPALRRAGERFACSSDGIQSEHVLSESIRAALGDIVRRDRHWEPVPPTLIAAPDGEQHVLPLHALAAGLAELNRPSVLLGASVPTTALAAAADRVEPTVIFLWSQDPATARPVDRTGVPTTTNRTRPALVLGGPGWPHRLPRWAAALVDDLPAALRVCLDPPSMT
ncbi:MAG: MerR family transcriptional regulator, light-induced transcriptional regulator [Pseudonocardiales bacterium]|nr:MerR family transcriptional regulator, light-induced transcriptional regulator [Pseudonocardiales bacterium]